ncbi:MAG: L,D-transpeptidase family protein [Paracoccaceae bacterium]
MYNSSNRVRAIVAGAALGVIFTGAAYAETTATGLTGEAPAAVALQVALAAPDAAADPARAYYQSAAYRGVWFGPEGDDRAARALIAALGEADVHALPAGRYRVQVLQAALAAAAGGAPAAIATAELAFTRVFLAYARDLSSGALEPRSVDRDLHVVPPRPNEAFLLARMADSPVETIVRLAPADPGYARLKDKLADLRGLPPDAWGPTAPGGGSIRAGESSPRVAVIRARLVALGYHQEITPVLAPTVYDPLLGASVRAFQRDYGLNDDGVIGQRTVEAMNASIEDRIGQVIVNMERMRWTNRDPGRRHIFVNQADFTVQLIDDGVVLFDERVVIGARRHRTPEFSDEMTHMVFNPTWNVPRSIATKEILPLLQEDPEYLSKKNMRLVSSSGETPPDPATTDWSLYSAADFPYRVKQNPGRGNSLGRVKFMFPNHHAIYLHDTPSKSLFRKDARAFSHGCIRVQDPMRLAEALLAAQNADPSGLIERHLGSGRETVVQLDTPIPVHLDYRTAWIGDDGHARYREDVYGRDTRVLAALVALGVKLDASADG